MAAGRHAQARKRRRGWVILVVCAAAVVAAAGGFAVATHVNKQAAATPSKPPPALTVASVTPTGTNVVAGSTISVHFSTALAPDSPLPTLSPPVAGGSMLRLQQLLAELGYLPLTFTPTAPVTSPSQEVDDQAGTFSWRWANQPSQLTTLWTPGVNNVITQGAVMNFENQNGLKTDGDVGPQVWTDLLNDVQSGKGDANAWNWVLVSQSLPESATFYSNGAVVYSTPVNTGVAGAPTDNGTWPVFSR